jgi:hypothetical protein
MRVTAISMNYREHMNPFHHLKQFTVFGSMTLMFKLPHLRQKEKMVKVRSVCFSKYFLAINVTNGLESICEFKMFLFVLNY